MEYLNIFLCVVLLVFTAFEGKRTITMYNEIKKASKELKNNKEVEECKDYNRTVSIYGSLIIIVFSLGVYLFMQKEYLTAFMIIGLSLLWINFIIESICTKTFYFYDSGFMYLGKQYKYNSVRGIDDQKRFLKGYLVKVIGNDEIYVTKDIRPIFEQKLKEYKNRKKK